MPFDALPSGLVTDAIMLKIARDGIATGWAQGQFGLRDEKKHCLIGWLLEAADWDTAEACRLAIDYVYPSLPAKSKKLSPLQSIWQYNDLGSGEAGKRRVLKLMDDAISLAV